MQINYYVVRRFLALQVPNFPPATVHFFLSFNIEVLGRSLASSFTYPSQESAGWSWGELNSEQASYTYQICQSANWSCWGLFALILVFLLFLHTFQCFSVLQRNRIGYVVFALPIFWPSAGIFKQSVGAMNRVGIRLSYRPARLHSLVELVPWNRFLGSFKV
jgi:hypothetical protein